MHAQSSGENALAIIQALRRDNCETKRLLSTEDARCAVLLGERNQLLGQVLQLKEEITLGRQAAAGAGAPWEQAFLYKSEELKNLEAVVANNKAICQAMQVKLEKQRKTLQGTDINA